MACYAVGLEYSPVFMVYWTNALRPPSKFEWDGTYAALMAIPISDMSSMSAPWGGDKTTITYIFCDIPIGRYGTLGRHLITHACMQ